MSSLLLLVGYLDMNGAYSEGILEGVMHYMPVVQDWLLLTRRQNASYSGIQACVRSRRSVQVVVVPLASTATRSWCRLEYPNAMISNDRPLRAGLNMMYIIAGLIR